MTRWLFGILAYCISISAWGAGSGLNVVVVVNQNSTNSIQLGNYYCEKRQIPPQNVLRTTWTGGNIEWNTVNFSNAIVNPLLAMLSARQLTNQIEYVVLSMDFPYRLTQVEAIGTNVFFDDPNSTTAALHYGFKADTNTPCTMAPASTSMYAGSEGIFRSTPPISNTNFSFLVTMITSSNLAQAKMVVDQGVNSDSTFPTQTVYLGKSTDPLRNVRFVHFDNTVFDFRVRGNAAIQRTNVNVPSGLGYMRGYQNGEAVTSVPPNSFAPGSIGDELTSYGGLLFENGGQTPLLAYLNAGATASYGTVTEPCNYFEKFPSPQAFFYQLRGFNVSEAYYQSVTNPYQGVVVGEPLSAPFARPASGTWVSPPDNALLSGTTNLTVQFAAADSNRPISQVDLFLDGNFLQTLTNIPPTPNNKLFVILNGFTTNITVPVTASIRVVASNLATTLNDPAFTNLTKVQAFAHGDRIELQSFDRSKSGGQLSVAATTGIGLGTSLTSYLGASRTNFLDTIAFGMRYFLFNTADTNQPPLGAWLAVTITKTNGTIVSLATTNTSGTATVPQLLSTVLSMVNTNSQLTGADGCVGEDFVDYASLFGDPTLHYAEFNLRARSSGWPAAQLTAVFTSAPSITVTPTGVQTLEDYVGDLMPRNHLYVTAGVTNLPVTFALNTVNLANGWRELTAVAYEGSHVRTQQRIAKTIQVQNGPLSAVFTLLSGASNTLVGSTLKFSVTANTNTVSKIELFSTGGSLSNVLGQSSAIFSVPGTNLDLGLHPFYAIVTTTDGKQYRTETKWIRLVNTPDAPFLVSIARPPPTISWPATAGRSYDILSATNLTNVFALRTTVTPSNSPAQWVETNLAAPRQFYRVRTAN
jgi:uncharacterized protein (TIGR03790 family)